MDGVENPGDKDVVLQPGLIGLSIRLKEWCESTVHEADIYPYLIVNVRLYSRYSPQAGWLFS